MIEWKKCETKNGCERADLGPYRMHIDPADGGAVWLASHAGVGRSHWSSSVEEAKSQAIAFVRAQWTDPAMCIVETVRGG